MAAKATAKRPASRPRPAAAPPAQPEPASGGFEPLGLSTSQEQQEERVVLFYIDDKPYTIPKRPRVNVALQFMHLAKAQGDAMAMDYLLEKLLGEEGYQALREYDGLTKDQFQQISQIAYEVSVGPFELPKA